MQFYIELTRTDGATTEVVYRTPVDEMSVARAKTKAAALLSLYAGRGANGARVLNDKSEEICKF
jgi:hypothetical protein